MSSNACQFERTVANTKKALDHAKAETIRRGGTWEEDFDQGRYVMQTPFGELMGTYHVVQNKVLFSVLRQFHCDFSRAAGQSSDSIFPA